MERLTERFDNGQIGVAGCGKNCKYDYKYCNNACEDCPTINEIYEKLSSYEDSEESRLLIRLPVSVGSTVYHLTYKWTKCSKYQQEMDEYNCQGCDLEECDSKKEWYIEKVKPGLSYIVEFLLTKELREKHKYFLTKEEAEKALEENKNK